jgi:hypothetical protein
MKDFKGTPGPWQILKDDGELKVIQKGSIEKGSGWRSYRPVCEEVFGTEDATLIAAAPDLLEALLRVRAQFSQAGFSPIAGSLNPVEDNFAFINSAIDKALGESQ